MKWHLRRQAMSLRVRPAVPEPLQLLDALARLPALAVCAQTLADAGVSATLAKPTTEREMQAILQKLLGRG